MGFYPIPSSLREMEDTMKMEFDTESGIVGVRRAEVDTAQLAAGIRAMLGVILINPITGDQDWYGPDRWPGLKRLCAHKVSTRPIGRTGNTPWDYGLLTGKTEMIVSYKVFPFDPDDDEDKREHPEPSVVAEQELDYHCEILTVPVKTTTTTTNLSYGSASSAPSSVTTDSYGKKNIRIPTIAYTLTVPKILKPDYALMNDLNGKINTVKIFGGAPETVLFDGPKLSNTVMSFGEPCWKLVMKFLYNRHGWQNVLDKETLKWVPAKSLDPNGQDPYETGDLKQLFKQIPKP